MASRPASSASVVARRIREKCQMSDTDIQNCLRGFAMHDREKRGTVRLCELKEVMLSTLEEELRDDEVFEIMCEAKLEDEGGDHVLNFGEFLRLMTERKRRINAPVSEDDLLEAYTACGGEADGGGCVNADILVRVIKEDFQLAIDIQELIAAVDEDGSGEIEFDEFKTLLSTALALGGDGDGDED